MLRNQILVIVILFIYFDTLDAGVPNNWCVGIIGGLEFLPVRS